MADELSIAVTVKCEKDGYYFRRPYSEEFTQTTAGQYVNTQTVGTTHEAIVVPADISTLGTILIVNQDTTNFVEIGRDVAGTFYPVAKIRAGRIALFEVPAGVTLYAKADTGACKCEISILSH